MPISTCTTGLVSIDLSPVKITPRVASPSSLKSPINNVAGKLQAVSCLGLILTSIPSLLSPTPIWGSVPFKIITDSMYPTCFHPACVRIDRSFKASLTGSSLLATSRSNWVPLNAFSTSTMRSCAKGLIVLGALSIASSDSERCACFSATSAIPFALCAEAEDCRASTSALCADPSARAAASAALSAEVLASPAWTPTLAITNPDNCEVRTVANSSPAIPAMTKMRDSLASLCFLFSPEGNGVNSAKNSPTHPMNTTPVDMYSAHSQQRRADSKDATSEAVKVILLHKKPEE